MTTTPINKTESQVLSEDDIVNYLRENPDFLVDRPALLAEMELPHHQHGSAISLVERQVSILRERNISMRHRLSELLHTARRNDNLFEKTRSLVMELVGKRSRSELAKALINALDQHFSIRHFRLLLINETGQPLLKDKRLVCLNTQQAQQPPLKSLLNQRSAFCGRLSTEEYQALFKEDASTIGSVAIAPFSLTQSHSAGALVLGNKDPDYYRSSTDTVFLRFIVDLFVTLFEEPY